MGKCSAFLGPIDFKYCTEPFSDIDIYLYIMNSIQQDSKEKTKNGE